MRKPGKKKNLGVRFFLSIIVASLAKSKAVPKLARGKAKHQGKKEGRQKSDYWNIPHPSPKRTSHGRLLGSFSV